MTIQELIARQQAIVSGARAAGRDLTAEERAEFDGLQRQIDAAGNNPHAQGNEGQGGEDPTGGARGMGNDNGQQGTDPTEAARQAVATERQRVSDITALCRQAGMDPAEYISNGATMDTVRQAAVDYLLAHGAPVSSRMNGDEGDNFRQAAVDAMLLRTGVNVQNPAKGAEEMRGYSLRDLAIECMARDGVGTTTSLLRMSKDDLWNEACRQFFNPTAAFPAILDNAIRKNIVQMYQEIPTTFQLWTTKGSVSDFKPTKDHSYLAGGAGEFLRVGENGELKADTPKTELLPQRQIDTFGRQFSMTRQAFINDDVGFITEMPVLYHLYHQCIGIAVSGNGHHPLHVAAGLALAPDLLTAAAPEHGAPLGNGQRQRFRVHVGKGEHLLCVVILHDGGDQAFFIKFQFHGNTPAPNGDTYSLSDSDGKRKGFTAAFPHHFYLSIPLTPGW